MTRQGTLSEKNYNKITQQHVGFVYKSYTEDTHIFLERSRSRKQLLLCVYNCAKTETNDEAVTLDDLNFRIQEKEDGPMKLIHHKRIKPYSSRQPVGIQQ